MAMSRSLSSCQASVATSRKCGALTDSYVSGHNRRGVVQKGFQVAAIHFHNQSDSSFGYSLMQCFPNLPGLAERDAC